MALPINVSDLIQQRVIESARIEYKSDWNPEPILHSICAFANDIDNWGGGYIIIGIDEENGMPQFPIKGFRIAIPLPEGIVQGGKLGAAGVLAENPRVPETAALQ